ncbi:putative immunity protein [Kribbella sp. NPDC023855]|uniref:putative immunity protein n=1 Tax=Kribbella sp. NPDC023855 TaxID=3154698 RepID=UPI0034090E9D
MTDELITMDDRRQLGLWAADCVERALPLFEAKVPHDTRPREALECVRSFGNGGERTKQIRTAAWAANSAARETSDPVAVLVARAALYVAGTAYIHSLESPHQVNHVFGPAVAAAQARELNAGGDTQAGDDEIRWAIEHAPPAVRGIVQRLPAGKFTGSRRGVLSRQLDEGLRGG